MDKYTNTGLILFCLLLTTGCMSTSEPESQEVVPETKPKIKRSLNQPKLVSLEPVDSGGNPKPAIQTSTTTRVTSAAGGAKSGVTLENTSSLRTKSQPNNTSSYFFIYESETYKSALSRWLNDEGYKKIGILLGDNQERLLNSKVTASKVIHGDFASAFSTLIKAAKKESIISRNGQTLSEDEKESLYIDVRLDKSKQEAIITSSKLPTIMFFVEKGSLLENYLKLGKAYDWDVREEFFFGDNEMVEFGYPIVTEKGNIKSALEQLLNRYEALQGALVPSVRQAFVLTNSRKK